MEWVYPRRRGPQWKQGWTGQTLSSISAPPLPLLTIFGIVIVLLWLSQYTDYKAQLHHTAINFQLFVFLLPILLIFLMISFSSSGRFAFWQQRLERETVHRSGGSPWGIAMLVGGSFSTAFLSIFISLAMVWTFLEVKLVSCRKLRKKILVIKMLMVKSIIFMLPEFKR